MKLGVFLLLVASVASLPTTGAGASAPDVAAPTLAACGGSVAGVSTCTFTCVAAASQDVVSFVGAGRVTATCHGLVSATCATGAVGACVERGDPAPCNCAMIGECRGEGVGFFTCAPWPRAAPCSDGLDNDGDGTADWPGDVNCGSPEDSDESGATPACWDGLDNDGDGLKDFPRDVGCAGPYDESEA